MPELRLELTAAIGCKFEYCGVAILLAFVGIGGGCGGSADEPTAGDMDSSPARGGAGAGAGAEETPDDSAAGSCNPSIARTVDWEDPEPDVLKSLPRFVWVGDGVISLSSLSVTGEDGSARQAGVQFRKQNPGNVGAIHAQTLWADGTAVEAKGMPLLDVPNGVDVAANGVVAVANDVIAIVDQVSFPVDAPSNESHCSYALARLGAEFESIQAPRPFSEVSMDSGSSFASECRVAALGDGFALIWRQRRANGADLFLQRIGPDGAARGERSTLLASETDDPYEWVTAVASDTQQVAVLLRKRVSDSESYTSSLMVADEASVQTRPFELSGRTSASDLVSLRAVNDGFIAWENWSSAGDESLWLLDHDFIAAAGPRSIVSGSHVARFGDGYVVVEHGEYLTATRVDAALAESSKPLGLSVVKDALLDGAFGDRDGRSVVVPYDDGAIRLAVLKCSGKQPGPLGTK